MVTRFKTVTPAQVHALREQLARQEAKPPVVRRRPLIKDGKVMPQEDTK